MPLLQFVMPVLGLVALLGPLAVGGSQPRDDPRAKARPARTDAYEDSLPVGAVARLGTLRWRHAVERLAFSRDGRYLAATGRETRVFDAVSGQVLRTLPGPSEDLCFPADGKSLITGHRGRLYESRYWDLATGKELRKMAVRTGLAPLASWSADGRLMACHSYEPEKSHEVAVWDLGSGKAIRMWDKRLGHRSVHQVALAPDGKIVAVREQSAICLFDVASGKELRCLASPRGHFGRPSLAFSADGKLLACTEQNHVRVWEVATGRSLHHLEAKGRPSNRVGPGGDGPGTVALSPDGLLLAAGGQEGSISLWDLSSGKQVHLLRDSHQNMSISVLAFSPDGKVLASQAQNFQEIRLWDVPSGRLLAVPKAPAGRVESVAFSSDGRAVVTADTEGAAWLWDATTGRLRRLFQGAGLFAFLGRNTHSPLAILPKGKTLVRGGDRSAVASWSLASGELLQGPPSSPGEIFSNSRAGLRLYPACSPDGRRVIAVFQGEVKRIELPPQGRRGGRFEPPPRRVHWTMLGLWDAQNGRMDAFRVVAEDLRGVVMSPDGRYLAGLGSLPDRPGETLLFVWDLARRKDLRELAVPPLHGWNPIGFSRDGRTLVTGPHYERQGGTGRFLFWEVATGRQRAAVECAVRTPSAPLTALAGDQMAALAIETTIHLVDLATGKELKRLEGHEGRVTCLAFSPAGDLLATGSTDTTALVWDLGGVVPVPRNVQLTAEELSACWAQLSSADAERAYQAVRLLARAPRQAVTLLQQHLRRVPFPEREALRRLLAALDSKRFAEREKAARGLETLGEAAEPALRQILEGQPSLEVRRRTEGVLAKMAAAGSKPSPIPTGEGLRALRALEVLERVGGTEAEQLLRHLADGSPRAAFTREALASWQRLTRRTVPTR